MSKLIPLQTEVYVVFSNDVINYGPSDLYYTLGVVAKHLKNSIHVKIGEDIITLKANDYSDSYSCAKDAVVTINGESVRLNKNSYPRIQIRSTELDEEYAQYFVDVEATYPKLTSGQIVMVGGRSGKVVFASRGNLRKVPRFLPDGHGRYYTHELNTITSYTLPSENQVLSSVEANYGFGRFIGFNKIEMPTIDLYIVQTDYKGDTDRFIALTSPKGEGNWSKYNNSCYETFSDCLIHTIAELNGKGSHGNSAALLLREDAV